MLTRIEPVDITTDKSQIVVNAIEKGDNVVVVSFYPHTSVPHRDAFALSPQEALTMAAALITGAAVILNVRGRSLSEATSAILPRYDGGQG